MSSTPVKERPIPFSAPMVRAILEGRKSQTRRVVRLNDAGRIKLGTKQWHPEDREARYGCPYGVPGDRVWVRETWAHDGPDLATVRSRCEDALAGGETYGPYYRADRVHENTGLTWRTSIHMPRWASRILLEVTDVRVERLQDISEADAVAEGSPPSHPSIDAVSREFGYEDFPRSWYAQLWESINGGGSWDANPWVWAISFRRVTP